MGHNRLKRRKFLFTIFTVLFLSAVAPKVFSATVSGETEVDIQLFPDLEAAIASPRTSGKTIVITRPTSCNTLTVPRNRKIRFGAGGSISVGGILDFQGDQPDAGDYQIFLGSGIVINLGAARVKWFGAKGDGKTEESAQVQKAINAVNKGDMLVTQGTYIVANLQLKTGVNITGQGAASMLKLPASAHTLSINGSLADGKGNYPANVIGTTLNHDGGSWFDNGLRARDENNSSYIVTDVVIKDLVIDGNNSRNTLGDVGMNGSAMGADISLNQVARITVENCHLINARLDGILVGYTLHGGSDYVTIKNCLIENNTRTGIALITGKYNKILDCTIKQAGKRTGIDVEANWDGEVNYRHLIKGNYVEGGIALASPRHAKMTGIIVEGNTVVTKPGADGLVLSSSRINGGSVISNNKLLGAGGGSAFVIYGDSGPTSGYHPIVISNNEATNYDHILPAQPNGSMANISMRDNHFTTKYGLQIYRPYKFEFSNNDVQLSGGLNASPLFLILFGQVSVDPDQGAAAIKGNIVRGKGVSKLIDATVGADSPAISPDFLSIVDNDIDVAASSTFPIDLYFGITLKGNKFANLKNSIHCPGPIAGMKIIDNEFSTSEATFPLIRNEATFKHAVITGNRLTGINLGVMRPQYCNISDNHVVNGKGLIDYSFTSGAVGSNKINGNSFVSDSAIDRAFEILIGDGYAREDFSGNDIITNNTHSGNYSAPAFLNTTPKNASGNSFDKSQ